MDSVEVEHDLAQQLLGLVRYRLEHPDYLSRDEYGSLLLDCFDRLQSELPFWLYGLPPALGAGMV